MSFVVVVVVVAFVLRVCVAHFLLCQGSEADQKMAAGWKFDDAPNVRADSAKNAEAFAGLAQKTAEEGKIPLAALTDKGMRKQLYTCFFVPSFFVFFFGLDLFVLFWFFLFSPHSRGLSWRFVAQGVDREAQAQGV